VQRLIVDLHREANRRPNLTFVDVRLAASPIPIPLICP
jgi:hypothetical protein